MSFSESEFASKKRVARKEAFLAVMEQVVLWKQLVERLEACYPKGNRGRPPMGVGGNAADAGGLNGKASPHADNLRAGQREPYGAWLLYPRGYHRGRHDHNLTRGSGGPDHFSRSMGTFRCHVTQWPCGKLLNEGN